MYLKLSFFLSGRTTNLTNKKQGKGENIPIGQRVLETAKFKF
jgi:hypothetical protein